MDHLNTFQGGMKGGIDLSMFPQDSYSYMLNGYLVSKDSHGLTITNVKGTVLAASFEDDEYPIGACSFNNILYIVTHMIVDTVGYVRVYSLNGSTGSGWIQDQMELIPSGPNNEGFNCPESVLGFNRNRLVEVIAKESYDGSVDLYICDGEHRNATINTGLDNDGILTGRFYSTYAMQNFIQIESVFKVPVCTSKTIEDDNAGKLQPGTYFFYLRYMDESLNTTLFVNEIGPCAVYVENAEKDESGGAYNLGASTEISKKITLNITNLDTTQKYLSIAYVHYFGNNGVINHTVQEISTRYTITGESMIIEFTDTEPKAELSIEDIYVNNIESNTCLTEVPLNDRYFGANWKSSLGDPTVLRDIAALILPYAKLYNDGKGLDRKYGLNDYSLGNDYMEDEIYPLGVSFLVDGGFKTEVYPICGWFEGFKNRVTGVIDNDDICMYEGDDSLTPKNSIKTILASLPVEERPAFLNALNCKKADDTKLGLYKFPYKRYIDSNASRYDFLSIGLDVSVALNYYNELANKPNISAIYLVQGDRIVNTITQGLCVACVESVGYEFNSKVQEFNFEDDSFSAWWERGSTSTRVIKQVDILGYKDDTTTLNLCFPWLDGSNYSLFDIWNIGLYRQVGQNFIYGDAFNRIVQVEVMNGQEEQLSDFSGYGRKQYPVSESSFYWSFDVLSAEITQSFMANHWNYQYQNRSTRKFAIYTPDLQMGAIVNNEGIGNDKYFIKPIGRFWRERSESSYTNFSLTADGAPNIDNNKYCFFHKLSNSDFNEVDSYFRYNDELSRILKENNEPLELIKSEVIYSGYCNIIESEQLISNFNSFSSKLNSFKKYKNTVIANTIDYLKLERKTLYDLGIPLNRTCRNFNNNFLNATQDEISLRTLAGWMSHMNSDGTTQNFEPSDPFLVARPRGNDSDDEDSYKYFGWDFFAPYGRGGETGTEQGIDSIRVNADNNIVPCVMSTLDMESIDYIAFYADSPIVYNKKGELGSDLDNGSYMQNSVVNICLFESTQSYINATITAYNLLNQKYKLAHLYDRFNEQDALDVSVRKGDLFSQKTYMRLIRWRDIENIDPTLYNKPAKEGRAMDIYLQSRVNSYLRVVQPNTYQAYMPYNKHIAQIDSDDKWVWEDEYYTTETFNYNDGYNQVRGEMDYISFDQVLLSVDNNHKNRIRYSNKHLSGSLIDAWKTISSAQYKDFRFDAGPINRLMKYNEQLFSVQESGINQHFIGDKRMSLDDSSEIIIGDPSILSDEYRSLADYGTQHKDSVVLGERGFYGVDWNKNKIWRVGMNTGDNGNAYFGAENLPDSKSLFDIFTYIKSKYTLLGNNINTTLPRDSYANDTQGIVSGYDNEKKQIHFTFRLGLNDDEEISYLTLVFSEEFDHFVGFYSMPANIYMRNGNRTFSFNSDTTTLWEHNKGEYQNIYGIVNPFELTFIVNGLAQENNSTNFEKEFLTHLMNMCPEILDSIEWETEWQSSDKNPFLNEEEFWSNPEYFEHTWRVPIMPNTKSPEVGPLETALPGVADLTDKSFFIFEDQSAMRGLWLRVKIKYVGVVTDDVLSANLLYLKNVVTKYIISFS